jgi:tRNA(fMet)-specific endonuclease VapC
VSYLLDTDHISILQHRSGPEHAALIGRIALHATESFSFSVVSFHEQVLGAHTFLSRAQTSRDVVRGYRLLDEIIRGFSAASILPFDDAASGVFDDLTVRRVRIATMDLRIAAIALTNNTVLLTRNVRDFGKVPGLTTEDWTA